MTHPTSPQQLACILRTTLVKRFEQLEVFTKVFQQFWLDQLFSGPSIVSAIEGLKNQEGRIFATGERLSLRSLGTIEQKSSAYSPLENFASKNFVLPDSQPDWAVGRNVHSLVRVLAVKEGVRYRKAVKGKLDLRRTTRQSLETQGEICRVGYRERKRNRGSVVVFCDVSGSMDVRSGELLRIMHAIQNSGSHAEIFVFSTELLRVSDLLMAVSLREAAYRISSKVRAWGSGTKIGLCLSTALAHYTRFLTRDTLVVIISDGWDVGDLRLLSTAMEQLRRRVRAILWLNPWADDPKFELGPSGLVAALPFVDLHTGPSILSDRTKLLQKATQIATGPGRDR